MAKDKEPENVPVPSHLKLDPKSFAASQGESFGGSSEILRLEEGEAAGPLTYLGARKMQMPGSNQQVDIHEARDSQGDAWRLPIATNFRRNVESANLLRGDVFSFMRLKDVIKKHGQGAGDPMEMYEIKVLTRATLAQTQGKA